jgi:hypothetical protein
MPTIPLWSHWLRRNRQPRCPICGRPLTPYELTRLAATGQPLCARCQARYGHQQPNVNMLPDDQGLG